MVTLPGPALDLASNPAPIPQHEAWWLVGLARSKQNCEVDGSSDREWQGAMPRQEAVAPDAIICPAVILVRASRVNPASVSMSAWTLWPSG